MSIEQFEGVVSRKVVKRNMMAYFKVDVPGHGTIDCTAKRQLFEGGLKDGYVPQEGDRVVIAGNMGRPGSMQVYTVAPTE